MLRCRCAPAARLVDRRKAERQAAPEEVEILDTSPVRL